MRKIKANSIEGKFEHILEEDKVQVTHLSLKENEEIPRHKSDRTVLVVIYRGLVRFIGEKESEVISPGDLIFLKPNEEHGLVASKDSDLLVIKVDL